MKVGVIGAGTMGQGIAKAFAQVDGYEVALCDIKQEWAEGGKDKIAKGYARLVTKGKMTQEAVDAILAKITPGVKEDLCADCDLIVEAAFEDMGVKKTTFAELDKIAKPECIFASNTSSLSITEIGNGLSRPMIGMHFFNPADRMKLIEVIAGANTPDETVETIKKISEEIGKDPGTGKRGGRFRCKPYSDPDDQRGCFHQDGRGFRYRRHRRGYEAGRKSSHGTPGAGRFRRTGYLPCHHGRSVQRDRRQQVSRMPADPQDGSRRQPRVKTGKASTYTTQTAPRPRLDAQ